MNLNAGVTTCGSPNRSKRSEAQQHRRASSLKSSIAPGAESCRDLYDCADFAIPHVSAFGQSDTSSCRQREPGRIVTFCAIEPLRWYDSQYEITEIRECSAFRKALQVSRVGFLHTGPSFAPSTAALSVGGMSEQAEARDLLELWRRGAVRGTAGEPPLPIGASNAALLDRLEYSRRFADINLSYAESEKDVMAAVSLLEDAFVHARRLEERTHEHAVLPILRRARNVLRKCIEQRLHVAHERSNTWEGRKAHAAALMDYAAVCLDLGEYSAAALFAGKSLVNMIKCMKNHQTHLMATSRYLTDDQHLAASDACALSSRTLVISLSYLSQNEKAFEAAESMRASSLKTLLATRRGEASIGMPLETWLPMTGPLEMEEIRRFGARHRVAIVMFMCGADKDLDLLVWVLGKDGVVTCRRLAIPPGEGSLRQLVKLTRSHVLPSDQQQRDLAPLESSDDEGHERQPAAAAPQSTSESPLRRCHQILIEPIAAVLADEPRVLLLPDRELYALPFAALRDASGVHLIEKHTLSIAPSIGTLIELEQRSFSLDQRSHLESKPVSADPLQERPSLVVGSPSTELSGALAEAKAVSDQLDRMTFSNVTHLTGDQATKTAVTAAMHKSQYIHLATHGSPEGLLVAGDTTSARVLSMAEVQELSLQPDALVVLSACNTFRGKLRADGIVGIARAFLAAGASSLLASLWAVDDEATFELMTRFYNRLLGAVETMDDTAAALQGAAVSMLQDGFSPYQWAAFVVFGGTSRLCEDVEAMLADAATRREVYDNRKAQRKATEKEFKEALQRAISRQAGSSTTDQFEVAAPSALAESVGVASSDGELQAAIALSLESVGVAQDEASDDELQAAIALSLVQS